MNIDRNSGQGENQPTGGSAYQSAHTAHAGSLKEQHINRMLNPALEKDEQREQEFDKFAAWLLSIDTGGNFPSDFIYCVNKLWRPHTPLNPNEYPSIQLVQKPKELEILEKRYKTSFTRPVIVMNIDDYQRFYKNMFNGGGSRGFNMRLPRGVNLIVSTPMPDFIHHELRHSIDPHFGKREGDNAVLDECVAFYGDIINPRVIHQTTTTTDPHGNKVTTEQRNILHLTMRQMGNQLKTDTHHKQCCPHRTFDEYKQIVDRVTGLLDKLSTTYSHEEIERILYHSKTIADIERMV